jgi:hypothetical protein
MNTPTYSYAYKYAAADGLRRTLAAKNEARLGQINTRGTGHTGVGQHSRHGPVSASVRGEVSIDPSK